MTTSGSDEPELRYQFEDQTPDYVPADAFDSVVVFYDAKESDLATATVIGPDRLLTAAHVVDDVEFDENGWAMRHVDMVPTRYRVVAQGDPLQPHGDWAVVQIEEPRWRDFAPMHADALRDGWTPTVGTEVFLVGYAAGFFPDRTVDVKAPTPSVVVEIFEPEWGGERWFGRGDSLHLGGMSGGPAMVWNAEHGRAEVIGVFSGYSPSTSTTATTARLLGVPVAQHEEHESTPAFSIQRLPVKWLKP